MPAYAMRYHDFSAGHRVVDQGGKCEHLHGHNYRVHFKCETYGQRSGLTDSLNKIGMVIDFSEINRRLCQWLEDHWDHKMLIWKQDPMIEKIFAADPAGVVKVPFNPTAENMAQYLVKVVGPEQFKDIGITLVSVTIEETRKCSASYEITE